MNTKVKNRIAIIAVAVVFYIIGSIVGWPNSDSLFKGDIGKVEKFNEAAVDDVNDITEERLMSDSTLLRTMMAYTSAMRSNTQALGAIIEMSTTVQCDDADIDRSFRKLNDMNTSLANINSILSRFQADLTAIAEGNKVENFTQSYNNALLAFDILDKQNLTAHESLGVISNYIENNALSDKELINLRNNLLLIDYTNSFNNFDRLYKSRYF